MDLSTMNTKSTIKLISLLALAVVGIIILFTLNPIVIIGAGQRGVIFNTVGGVEDRVLSEGIHFRTPFVQSVIPMNVRVQKDEVRADAASKDLQTVSTNIVVNYHLQANKVNKIYQQIGDETVIIDRIIKPAVSEVVKAATARLTAEEVLTKRPELKANIDKLLSERLAEYNVVLDDVSIVDVDFSKEFDAAIEAKQIAEQDAQKARFVALQAEQEAQAEINRAKGAAEAQRLQQLTLTGEILQKMAIEKWNGAFPTYYGGNVLPFLNIAGR